MFTRSQRLALLAANDKIEKVMAAFPKGIVGDDLKRACTSVTHAIRHSDEEKALQSVKAYVRAKQADEERKARFVKA